MDHTSFQERFWARVDSPQQICSLFDLLPGVSFFVKDRKGRFVSLNRRGCDYCGVNSEDEAVGKTDFDFFPHSRAQQYHDDDLAVMSTGEPIINRIEDAPEAEGSPRLVMTTKIPLRNSKGRVIGLAGFSRQVGQLKQSHGTASEFARAVEMLHTQFNQNLTTDDLADAAGLSVSQFERRFRKAFGTSVRKYLLKIRIENATRLLTESDNTIVQIALACGFYDHAHFSRSFKRITGVTPSDFRNGSSNE